MGMCCRWGSLIGGTLWAKVVCGDCCAGVFRLYIADNLAANRDMVTECGFGLAGSMGVCGQGKMGAAEKLGGVQVV